MHGRVEGAVQSGVQAAGEPLREMLTPFDARETLVALARPRLSTSPGFEDVAAEVGRRFAGFGYEAAELPFTFAPWVGRFGLPVAAAAYLLGVLPAGILLLLGRPLGAAVALLVAAAGVAAVALSAPHLLHGSQWARRPGVNRLYHAPGTRPLYILMAHLDTKSQLIPLSLRAPAIVVAAVSWLWLLGIALLLMARPVSGGPIFLAAVAGILAGTLLALSWGDNDSPGALDNASGVATLLGVAARERDAGDVAFLVTDAEELGLAGARAAANRLQPVHGVINIDGVDDAGRFWIVERAGWRRRGLTSNLVVALLTAADQVGVAASRRRLPIGVLLDHMPIAKAGLPALSLLRGTVRSLNRVHRPSDDATHLEGTGIARAVDLLCAALAELRARQAGTTRTT